MCDFGAYGAGAFGYQIGSKQITQFGMTSEVFDQILENVDGYVMLERSHAAGHTTQRVAQALTERPGVIYPMATTAALRFNNFRFNTGCLHSCPRMW